MASVKMCGRIHIDIHKACFCKKSYSVEALKGNFGGKGGGGILNETISCCLIEASESKHPIDSFILSFSEGSWAINDLYRYLTILYISW